MNSILLKPLTQNISIDCLEVGFGTFHLVNQNIVLAALLIYEEFVPDIS